MPAALRWQCLIFTRRLHNQEYSFLPRNLESEKWSLEASPAAGSWAMAPSAAMELGSGPRIPTRSRQVTFRVDHSVLTEGLSEAPPSPDLVCPRSPIVQAVCQKVTYRVTPVW